MPEIASEALPVLLRVTACAALVVPDNCAPKVSEVAEKFTLGPLPVPLRLTTWGLFEALSETVRVPLRVPIPVGVKLTLI
jgi:hypothetical protein